MSSSFLTVAQGFGPRLREERERIGLNQAQLAALAGVQRLAQGLYESEARSPSIKYLMAIGESGVDLYFVLFGTRMPVQGENVHRLEKRVFELVEEFAQKQPSGQLGAEGRYAMFVFLRDQLANSRHEPQGVS